MYWNRNDECISRHELKELQFVRLKETVERASRAPFYREKGLGDYTIRDLSDIRKLPVTTKQDLRDAYPYGMICTSLDEVVRLHSSSGTTGIPTVIYHSALDLHNWTELVARCLYMMGLRRHDVFQNMIGYGLFTGGLGLHYGAERLGCLTIPTGPGNTKRQLKFMKEFKTTAIHVIPSYALHLADTLEAEGIDPRTEFPDLSYAILGAEPHSEETRRKVQDFFGIRAFNSYGLSEMNGPGVAFECPEMNGMHIWEDAYLVEIVDPDTLEPLPAGSRGELLITTLSREAMPIIRYRTKDLTSLEPGECACGRTHARINRITGRSDDMMILKGVNIFPIQIESVLNSIPGVGRNYRIILEQKGHNDHMIVQVEIDPSLNLDAYKSLERLKNRITQELKGELLITPEVDLREPGSIPVAEGKAVRVIDNRRL
ncbi:MAG: phenylacetate--CoA ligase [Desulfomonilia bacterium]|jgi:phenylacetate-CoA ligase|nr:phenylacetate--CoA ligase [Deltaproteobacteria bacterium]MDX9762912.1 phenylacetate--CoA ligase [Desulfomonilia bacterium]HPW69286.1 phenylacetate--CoA ligase [Deltaproteobacteria bacterium]